MKHIRNTFILILSPVQVLYSIWINRANAVIRTDELLVGTHQPRSQPQIAALRDARSVRSRGHGGRDTGTQVKGSARRRFRCAMTALTDVSKEVHIHKEFR